MPATLNLEIPSDALESARMSVGEANLELAIVLFSKGRLSLGKAAELVELSVGQFQFHLGARGIGAHYDVADALKDHAILAQSRSS